MMGLPAPTTVGQVPKGPQPTQLIAALSIIMVTAVVPPWVRDHWGHVLQPADQFVSGRVFGPLFLRRLLQRLDQPTGSRQWKYGLKLRHRYKLACRSESGRCRQPVLPGTRLRGHRRALQDPIRFQPATRHYSTTLQPDCFRGPDCKLQRQCIRNPTHQLSVATKRANIQCDGIDLYTAGVASPKRRQFSLPGQQFLWLDTSSDAILTVTTNLAPTGAIVQPAAGTFYSAGQTLSFAGTATDPEQGNLS